MLTYKYHSVPSWEQMTAVKWPGVLRRRWPYSHLWAASEQPRIWTEGGGRRGLPVPPASTWFWGQVWPVAVTSSSRSAGPWGHSDQYSGPVTFARSSHRCGGRRTWYQHCYGGEGEFCFIYCLLLAMRWSRTRQLLRKCIQDRCKRWGWVHLYLWTWGHSCHPPPAPLGCRSQTLTHLPLSPSVCLVATWQLPAPNIFIQLAKLFSTKSPALSSRIPAEQSLYWVWAKVPSHSSSLNLKLSQMFKWNCSSNSVFVYH